MISESCIQLDLSTKRVDLVFHIFDSGKVALAKVDYEELKDLEDQRMELEELFYLLATRGINLVASHLSCTKKGRLMPSRVQQKRKYRAENLG